MTQVNMYRAKTDLSKLIVSLENKEEDMIIIARDGHPVASLTLYVPKTGNRVLGKFNGKYVLPEDINECNYEVCQLMEGTLE